MDHPPYIHNGFIVNDQDVEPLVIPVMNFAEEPDEAPRSNVRTHQTHQPKPELTLNGGVQPLLPPNWGW